MTQYKKCPVSAKTRFPDPGAAKEALIKIKSQQRIHDHVTGKRKNRGMKKPQIERFYYCTHCRGYHLTKAEAPLKQKKREKLFNQRLKDITEFVKDSDEAAAWKADSLPFPNQNQQL